MSNATTDSFRTSRSPKAPGCAHRSRGRRKAHVEFAEDRQPAQQKPARQSGVECDVVGDVMHSASIVGYAVLTLDPVDSLER